MVISDLDGRAQVLRNKTENTGHWLQIHLQGKGLNRDAVGSLIKVRTGKSTMIRQVRSGTGYLSQDDLRQHFGLGSAKAVDEIEVIWPDGSKSVQKKIAVDQILKDPPTLKSSSLFVVAIGLFPSDRGEILAPRMHECAIPDIMRSLPYFPRHARGSADELCARWTGFAPGAWEIR